MGKPVYPKGKARKFAFFDKPLAVYEDTVTVRVPLKVAGSAKPGVRRLAGLVKYQACTDKNCLLPARTKFDVKFRVK